MAAVHGCAQALIFGGDTQLQFARAWAVAQAAYGCDIIRPVLLRESPLNLALTCKLYRALAAILF